MSKDYDTRVNESIKEFRKAGFWFGVTCIPGAILFLDILDAFEGAATPVGGNTGAAVTIAAFVVSGAIMLHHYSASDRAKIKGTSLSGDRDKPKDIRSKTMEVNYAPVSKQEACEKN
jgi:hypothetical protein